MPTPWGCSSARQSTSFATKGSRVQIPSPPHRFCPSSRIQVWIRNSPPCCVGWKLAGFGLLCCLTLGAGARGSFCGGARVQIPSPPHRFCPSSRVQVWIRSGGEAVREGSPRASGAVPDSMRQQGMAILAVAALVSRLLVVRSARLSGRLSACLREGMNSRLALRARDTAPLDTAQQQPSLRQAVSDRGRA